MNVSDVMSRKVVTLLPDSSFQDAWRTIFKKKVNALPVVDKKKHMVGIVTRQELLSRLYPNYKDLFASVDASYPDFEHLEDKIGELSSLKTRDIMSKHVIFAHATTPIMRALSRMIVHRINQLPVLGYDEVLLGMVTKGDIFSSLFTQSNPAPKKKKK